MLKLEGINLDSVTVDGGWLEKRRRGDTRGRFPLEEFKGATVNELSRRKKILFGEKEELLQVLLNFGTATVSIQVPAERRAEVNELIALLEDRGR
jgi:hypothetical protein